MKTFFVVIFAHGVHPRKSFSYKGESLAVVRAELLLKYKVRPTDLWIQEVDSQGRNVKQVSQVSPVA